MRVAESIAEGEARREERRTAGGGGNREAVAAEAWPGGECAAFDRRASDERGTREAGPGFEPAEARMAYRKRL